MSAVLSVRGARQALRRAARRCATSASTSAPGELVAVVGPNGAGKTTLLSIIAGIQRAERGHAVAPAAAGSAGSGGRRSSRRSTRSCRCARTCELFARLERVADPRAAVARMLEQTGLRERAGERVGAPLRRQPPARQRRARADRRPAGARARRALRRARPGASASGCGSSSRGSRRRGHERAVLHPQRRRGRSATPTRAIVLADGELLFDGAPAELLARERRAGRRRPRARARRASSAAARRTEALSWLLRKDLLILRRSRLLVALLVVYPVAIALLIGFAISRSPSRPRVAIVDRDAARGRRSRSAAQRVQVSHYAEQLFSQVQAVRVPTRAQAIAKVKSGDVLAAVVIPPDIAARDRLGHRARRSWKSSTTATRSSSRSCSRSSTRRSRRPTSASPNRSSRRPRRRSTRCCSGGNLGVLGAPAEPDRPEPDPAGAARGSSPASRPAATAPSSNGSHAFADFAAQNLTLEQERAVDRRPADPGRRARCCMGAARR